MEFGDELLSQSREMFYTGYFDKCLDLLERTHPTLDSAVAEKLTLQARSKLCLNRLSAEELTSILNSSCPALKAVALLAACEKAETNPEQRMKAVEGLKELSGLHDSTAKLLAAEALCKQDDFPQALEMLRHGTLEMKALTTFILLSIHRVDLAERSVEEMTSANDDAAVTKLASAWVNQALGSCQEAYLTYNDIQSQICEGEETEGAASISMLNGKAVANVQRKQWQEAWEELQRAFQQDTNSAVTLANLVCCAQNRRNPNDADSFFTALQAASPTHPMVTGTAKLHQAFAEFHQTQNLIPL